MLTLLRDGVNKEAQNMIEVEQGAIQGTEMDSKGVVAFLGLPYAAAPIGALRFEPPQPARRWEGVLKAIRFGPRSIQRRPFADLIFRSRENERRLPYDQRLDAGTGCGKRAVANHVLYSRRIFFGRRCL